VLKAQVTEQISAEHDQRTEDRKAHRNGSHPHPLTTRVGAIALHVPRLRDGKFSTDMFSRYQRSEQAFIPAMPEMGK
ncbi:MAG: IS256 family transposase, partial [Syntrophomonadaceae bacterium]|nr:IS256 family transposase [Syntrophomonadaceae bacterium]